MSVGPTRGRPAHVLVVDDHADTADVLARALRMMGYAVRTARSCGTAVAAADEGPLDLIVCDIELPDGDGDDLLRGLRMTRPSLAAVAVSGHGRDSDPQRFDRAGFDAWLVKPVALPELRTTLARVLGDGSTNPSRATVTPGQRSDPRG